MELLIYCLKELESLTEAEKDFKGSYVMFY